jgi:hypothetical protein
MKSQWGNRLQPCRTNTYNKFRFFLADFKNDGFSERISKPYTVESLSRILADVIKNGV